MKLEFITDNILHYTYGTQYQLCSAFIRIQEFFESPYDSIRGQHFSLDYYMDLYADKHDGEFTYFEDWSGFNIPGNVIRNFLKLYKEDLREKERKILTPAFPFIQSNNKFYIIGTYVDNENTLDHEIAHAYYYLDDTYKNHCKQIYSTIPQSIKTKICEKLINYGYTEDVFEDEVQAYFSTESVTELQDRFMVSSSDINEFVKLYTENIQRHKFQTKLNNPPLLTN